MPHLIYTLQRSYKRLISPMLGPRCRFYPSCSSYCAQSISAFGWFKGGWLTITRLCRCHPLADFGVDPVPERFSWRMHWAGTRPQPAAPDLDDSTESPASDSDKLPEVSFDHDDKHRVKSNEH
jgi:uncharacterized protein